MKKLFVILYLGIFAFGLFTSCSDEETYAEQKKKEKAVISGFIASGINVVDSEMGDTVLSVAPIKVISESQFYAQDTTTNVAQNEYVLFSGTGVYMQIIRKGVGEKLESGKTATIICRYVEYNIMGDSIQSRNNTIYYIATPDKMSCKNSYGTITASFLSGVMKTTYLSTAVPAGWLIPLSYIRIGRQSSEDEQIAKVRLIVPHSQGQTNASANVYPCFYEITYQKTR